MNSHLLLAAFDWPHAVTLLAAIIAGIVALLPAARRRGRPAPDRKEPDAHAEGRLASIETRLTCVETSLAEHRRESREWNSQILDHLLNR